MSGMDELATWLRAQLDDDQRLAREANANDRAPWRYQPGYDAGRILGDDGYTVVHVEAGTPEPVTAEHIARWDPARVLAKVDADRRMLDLHKPDMTEAGWPLEPHAFCAYCAGLCHSTSGISCERPLDGLYPCPTVRLLALAYADRPGYREEWRP